MNETLKNYIQLMRMEKPIGSFLLLAPTWLGLGFANLDWPSWKNFIIFTLGVIIMRSAGCVANDLADRNIDKHVERTKNRPITSGKISVKQAIVLLLALLLIALLLVLQTDLKTILWSIPAVLLAVLYPLAKRITYYPQCVLALAFSMGIIMAFVAESGSVTLVAWLLVLANMLWVVAYDTEYAMADREDDLKIGVKSTAIAFGHWDKLIIGLLQALMVLILIYIGVLTGLSWFWWFGVVLVSGLFLYQQVLIRRRERMPCFQAFINNQWVGLVLVLALCFELFA